MSIHLPTDRDRDAWQLAIWNMGDDEVSRAQKLQFMLMLEASFNNFDAFNVVRDLLKRRDLWEGVIMQRDDLISLRDIHGGHWSADTLYILTEKWRDSFWDELKERWSADEVHWMGADRTIWKLGTSDPKGKKVLRVWWD